MDIYANKRIDEYIVKYKNEIKEKITSLDFIQEKEKISELLEFVYEYTKLQFEKEEFIEKKKNTYIVSPCNRCVAKRTDGEQCTRKKKRTSEYCGTHSKTNEENTNSGQPIYVSSNKQKMEISAEDIQGIIYYIDKFNNVYHTEDILEGKENPRIITKVTKNSDNKYIIPQF
jgi:hypothetical protein